MAENYAHGHFRTRLGISQAGREHRSLSDLTSGLTSCSQVRVSVAFGTHLIPFILLHTQTHKMVSGFTIIKLIVFVGGW